MKWMLVSFGLLASVVSVAQVDVSTMSLDDAKPETQRDIYNPKGFWPMLGAGFGYMNKGNDIRSEGLPANLKFLGSYYLEGPVVVEGGAGLYNEILTQKGGGADTIQALQLETGVRYLLPDRWQLGPVWSTLTGNNRYSSNTKNWTSFLGVQVKRDIAWEGEYLVRMGGRFMTDVGVSGEQINAALFEVEVGLGEGSKPLTLEEPVKDRAVASHLADQAMGGPIVFDGPMNFIENKSQMISTADRRANRLAQVLADNSHLFDRIIITGHADERGTVEYNQRLSEDRADSVASKLKRAGLPANRVQTQGKGKLEPLAFEGTETAWFKNRRVEVLVLGVKDQVALESLLRTVR